MYVDVKPVVMIVLNMDLHAMGGRYDSRGATIAYSAVFRRCYYLRGATKQRASIRGNTVYTLLATICTAFKCEAQQK